MIPDHIQRVICAGDPADAGPLGNDYLVFTNSRS